MSGVLLTTKHTKYTKKIKYLPKQAFSSSLQAGEGHHGSPRPQYFERNSVCTEAIVGVNWARTARFGTNAADMLHLFDHL